MTSYMRAMREERWKMYMREGYERGEVDDGHLCEGYVRGEGGGCYERGELEDVHEGGI